MSDAYSVIYSPEAIDDLREIYSYIAFTLLVPETAEKQVNRIIKNTQSQLKDLEKLLKLDPSNTIAI